MDIALYYYWLTQKEIKSRIDKDCSEKKGFFWNENLWFLDSKEKWVAIPCAFGVEYFWSCKHTRWLIITVTIDSAFNELAQ